MLYAPGEPSSARTVPLMGARVEARAQARAETRPKGTAIDDHHDAGDDMLYVPGEPGEPGNDSTSVDGTLYVPGETDAPGSERLLERTARADQTDSEGGYVEAQQSDRADQTDSEGGCVEAELLASRRQVQEITDLMKRQVGTAILQIYNQLSFSGN